MVEHVLIIGLIFSGRAFETNRVKINFRITGNIGPISTFYKLMYSHFSKWFKRELAFLQLLIQCNQFSDNVQYCFGLNIEAEELVGEGNSCCTSTRPQLRTYIFSPIKRQEKDKKHKKTQKGQGHSYPPRN